MPAITFPTGIDVNLPGRFTPKFLDVPVDCVGNLAIPSTTQIDPTKLGQLFRPDYKTPSTLTVAAVTHNLYVARFAGTLDELLVGTSVACIGGATITTDLKKNGTTVLSSTIVLNNANTARVGVLATINPAAAAYVAGDWFELVVTVAAGGGTIGTGYYAIATFNERSQT